MKECTIRAYHFLANANCQLQARQLHSIMILKRVAVWVVVEKLLVKKKKNFDVM